jgi:hypothetical protein
LLQLQSSSGGLLSSGEEVKTAPESSGDVDYQIKLAAFTEQNDFIEELGKQFAQGFGDGQPFNAKDLFVEMMMSPWFRGLIRDKHQCGLSSLRCRFKKIAYP